MEIPEYNPEIIIPRIKNSEYWPYAKFIPVLSETALEILREKGAIELRKDAGGEEIIRIMINNKSYDIPKILTSKGTLSWLGFTKERVDVLWDSLVKVSPPMITPSISDGGEWAFWQEIKLWIGDEMYAITKRSTDQRDDLWNKKVMDRIGFEDLHRSKRLKLMGENGQMVYTHIQDQKPQDLLALVQRYVYYRWNMLAQMNKMILLHSSSSHCYSSSGMHVDCITRLAVQFEMDPIDLDAMYGHRINWSRVERSTPLE